LLTFLGSSHGAEQSADQCCHRHGKRAPEGDTQSRLQERSPTTAARSQPVRSGRWASKRRSRSDWLAGC
jgi:hypothetical protein